MIFLSWGPGVGGQYSVKKVLRNSLGSVMPAKACPELVEGGGNPGRLMSSYCSRFLDALSPVRTWDKSLEDLGQVSVGLGINYASMTNTYSTKLS